MFKFVIVAFALIASAVAKPGLLASAPLAYANAPLYAPGGSNQVDIRNNYDGTLSSYATAPFGYAGPFASRYVSGVPAAYAAAAAPLTAAPLAAAPLPAAPLAAAPFAAPAPLAAAYAAAPFAHPFNAPFAAPFAAPYAAPYAASPFAAPFAAPAPALI